jgi:MYXO-CTERM domain-containing protein
VRSGGSAARAAPRLAAALGAVCALAAGRSAGAQVVFDAMTQESARAIAQLDILSMRVGSGPNRLLLVGLELGSATASVTSVRWAGVPLARVGTRSITGSAGGCTAEVWQLVAPASGGNQLSVQLSTAVPFGVGAVSYSGVDPRTPTSGPTTSIGADGMIAVQAGGANQPLFGSACLAGTWPEGRGQGAPNTSVGAGQATLWDFTEQDVIGLGTHRMDVASTLTWNVQTTLHYVWAGLGMRILAAGSAPLPDAAAPDRTPPPDANVPPDAPAMRDGSAPDGAPDRSPPPDTMTPDTAPAADGAGAEAPPDDALARPDEAAPADAAPDDARAASDDAPSGRPEVRLQVGCACQAGGRPRSPGAALLVALVGLALVRRATARSRGPR